MPKPGSKIEAIAPHWESGNGEHVIYRGDCLDVLRTMSAESVDAVVTDPPYGLGFMGKKWDGTGIAFDPDTWIEVFRVAKPGAHLLVFGGTRTWHRLAMAIEDAGWEIRDTICWLYGSGFPKSLDVSKAIDKAAGAERTQVVGTKLGRPGMARDGSNQRNGFDAAFGGEAAGLMPTDITAPATDAAKQWSGWGTALKPSWEPVLLCRKPLVSTVAANVLQHGTGGLNIDGCRIEHGESAKTTSRKFTSGQLSRAINDGRNMDQWERSHSGKGIEMLALAYPSGRWPANLAHDGSEEVLEAFAKFGESQSKSVVAKRAGKYNTERYGNFRGQENVLMGHDDAGSAARFFFTAKASTEERRHGKNNHPTVKPLELIRWLVKLVCPPGGICLDLFLGSGTTGVAAVRCGCKFIGIEREAEYVEIAVKRMEKAMAYSRYGTKEYGKFNQEMQKKLGKKVKIRRNSVRKSKS